MISRTDFLRACKRARRSQPEFAYGGMGLGLGLGLSHLQGRSSGAPSRIYPLYPFQIPGEEYAVGRTSTNPLKNPIDNPIDGTTRINERIIVNTAGVEIRDYDLRGYWVDQTNLGSNTTITQCLVDNSAAPAGANVSYAVYHYNDLIFRYNTLSGVDSPNQGTAFVGHYPGSATARIVYEYNDSSRAPQFHLTFAGGTVRYNRMLGVGYVNSIPLEIVDTNKIPHGNVIYCGRLNVASQVYENYGSMTPCPDTTRRWSYCFFATSINGPNSLGCEVKNNLWIYGSFVLAAGDVRYAPANAMAGINFHDNWCNIDHANCLGYIHPTYQGAVIGTNYNVLTGAPFTPPPGDIGDLSASVLSGTSVQLTFTAAENADSYEYSYNSTGSTWDGPTWFALAGNGIVTGVAGADTKYWRVRAKRSGTGNVSGSIYGNASNIALPGADTTIDWNSGGDIIWNTSSATLNWNS